MDDIFGNAKSILVVWTADGDQEKLSAFQDVIQTKSKAAEIAPENVQVLLQSKRAISSIDLILFDLVNDKDSSISIDLVTEFFRLLRPDGHLLAHVEHSQQSQVINNFKMCGFDSCNPLDANSSFLIENKTDEVKKLGSLWLCQKPSFDVGYSVPLQRTGVRFMKQISTTGRGRKTWTVENEEDLSDHSDSHDDYVRKQSDTKNIEFRSTPPDARTASSPPVGSPPFKPTQRVAVPKMSDV